LIPPLHPREVRFGAAAVVNNKPFRWAERRSWGATARGGTQEEQRRRRAGRRSRFLTGTAGNAVLPAPRIPFAPTVRPAHEPPRWRKAREKRRRRPTRRWRRYQRHRCNAASLARRIRFAPAARPAREPCPCRTAVRGNGAAARRDTRRASRSYVSHRKTSTILFVDVVSARYPIVYEAIVTRQGLEESVTFGRQRKATRFSASEPP
jgi:hypothetical protein